MLERLWVHGVWSIFLSSLLKSSAGASNLLFFGTKSMHLDCALELIDGVSH